MGVRSTNKANYGPRWESLNTYFHNGHMGEFYNTQMRAGKGTEPVTGPFDATGGTKFTYGGKTIHAFTSPGTFSTTGQGSKVLTYFIIAGGGGGGCCSGQGGGGGGAGAYHTGDTPQAILGGDVTFPVVVGAGGAGGTIPASPSGRGSFGEDSWVSFPTGTIQAGGGGFGGGDPAGYRAGGPGGGSGGAAGPNNNTGVNANQWTPISPRSGDPWGTEGAESSGGIGGWGGSSSGDGGAGGGGAAEPGGDAGWPGGMPTNYGGVAGKGVQLPTVFRDPTNPYGEPGPNSEDFWVGGGGGGAASPGNPNAGGGGAPEGNKWAGAGKGHRGGAYGTAMIAVANTGSGGGGWNSEGNTGPNVNSGGSGLVLIAYTPG